MIASVDDRGLCIGRSQGSTDISASFNGQSASAAIEVISDSGELEILPSSLTLAPLNYASLRAVLVIGGEEIDVTRNSSWRSLNPTVATVHNSDRHAGLVQTHSNDGVATLRVSYKPESGDLVVAEIQVTVLDVDARPDYVEVLPSDHVLTEPHQYQLIAHWTVDGQDVSVDVSSAPITYWSVQNHCVQVSNAPHDKRSGETALQ